MFYFNILYFYLLAYLFTYYYQIITIFNKLFTVAKTPSANINKRKLKNKLWERKDIKSDIWNIPCNSQNLMKVTKVTYNI